MDELKLISIYCYIEDLYNRELQWLCQRFSNNGLRPKFTDAELLSIYLFSIIEEEKYKVKSIYTYAKKYLLSFFPTLPSYQAFNRRLNRLSDVFDHLIKDLMNNSSKIVFESNISLIDSMPIVTCSPKRSAKVARHIVDKGYNSTKKMHFYGVKLHVIGTKIDKSLPAIEYIGISKASEHDLTHVRTILETAKNRNFFADKAYCDKALTLQMKTKQNSTLNTPVKSVKGQTKGERQFNRAADSLLSTAVSATKQSIEALFGWLIEKTDIQKASKVRSASGLLVHILGKVAAAITKWVF